VIAAHICGIDFNGVVTKAPAGCAFAVGERVFGVVPPLGGTWAEYVRVPTDCIARMPEALSFMEASALPLVGLTALQAFEDNHLAAGQHVLVLGASGGAGQCAVQIAKSKGAAVTPADAPRPG
jgi:NADPH:quinone reductase-like Zn-dependent oxidoreductase